MCRTNWKARAASCIGAGSRPVVVSRSRIDTTEMPRANQSSGG
jgi:hypothetical protein